MRTFRLIETALLSLILCINLASCSNDENSPIENTDNVTTTQKKLIQLKKLMIVDTILLVNILMEMMVDYPLLLVLGMNTPPLILSIGEQM